MKTMNEALTELAYLENKIEELEGRLVVLKEKLNKSEKWDPPEDDGWVIFGYHKVDTAPNIPIIGVDYRQSGHAYPDQTTATRIATHLRKRDRLTKRIVELDPDAGEWRKDEDNWVPLYDSLEKEWKPYANLTLSDPFATYTRNKSVCRQVCNELNSGYLEL